MLLSKDFLEEGFSNEQAPLASSSGLAYGDDSGTRPTTATSRPTSSYGRPARNAMNSTGMSINTDTGGGDDQGTEATPMSSAAVRQKMLQQRQRMLQKAKAAATPGASSMVMANEAMPTADANASRPGTGAGRSTPTSSSGGFGGPQPSSSAFSSSPGFGSSKSDLFGGLGNSAASASLLSNERNPEREFTIDSTMSRLSVDEQDASGLVIPAPQASPEEEAKRRSTLAQELDERGICPVFDPTPTVGPVSTFDMSTVAPGDMKRFLHDPTPTSAAMLQCRVVRLKGGLLSSHPKYRMESDSGIFMMSAQKQQHNKTSNYAVSMSKSDIAKESDKFLGKLRSDLFGLEFCAYGPGSNPKKIDASMSPVHAVQHARQELMAVQYSSSMWGAKPRGPRKMNVIIPRVQQSGERLVCRTLRPETEGLMAIHKSGTTDLIDTFTNKPPKWNEQIGAYVLNFNKRVTQASVKNFQLTRTGDPDTVYLQFGRVGKDEFNMDFRHPISPFQAFAICLSSFDYKLCCE